MRDVGKFFSVILIVLMFGLQTEAQADDRLWAALRSSEAVAMIRHSIAPGIGDPDHFRLDDCATQRNLSAAGQRQAQAIGEAFRRHGITAAQVLSSRWCRCLDTARLLNLGTVEPFPALDSFFSTPERSASQTAALRERLQQDRAGQPLVLVTHQVNITALTGVVPGSGEMVVIKPAIDGGVEVLGRLQPVENRNSSSEENSRHHLASTLQHGSSYPVQLLDDNLAMDRNRIQYVDRLPHGETL